MSRKLILPSDMPNFKPTRADVRLVDGLVAKYQAELDKIALFGDQLYSALGDSVELAPHVHSFKTRLKDPEHLRDKLKRKILERREVGKSFEITRDNLLARVNDLVGIRILHLYTRQIREIDAALRSIFAEQKYGLREGPFARTWDDESRAFFQSCGIKTQKSPTMYTSVHAEQPQQRFEPRIP